MPWEGWILVEKKKVTERWTELFNSLSYVFTIWCLCSSERGRNYIENSVGDRSKIYFWDLPIDRIPFNAQMHDTVNTGLYRITDLRFEFIMFQYSKRIRWLQGIVKRWAIKSNQIYSYLFPDMYFPLLGKLMTTLLVNSIFCSVMKIEKMLF